MSIASQIVELEQILNTGAKSVFVDGQKVEYDLAAVRQRLAELKRKQAAGRRPRIATINLSNF